MSTTKPVLLAFFGATGGCTLAALVPALKAGYNCTALARTPSKLTNLLLSRGVSQSDIDNHLRITAGDVLDITSVKANLSHSGRNADIIFSGIGITNFAELTAEVAICSNAISNILAALTELKPAKRPLLVALSSTGITQGKAPRDLPLLMVPIYYYMLANPHKDKIHMEEVIEEHYASRDCQISGSVIVRPSLLMNGAAKGGENVRVGTESKPAVGYTINRDDVGLWMFETLVKGDGLAKYKNEKPSLTY